MGLICKIKGHSWDNGKCKRCGIVHLAHEWVPHDKHVYYCRICGKKATTPHNFVGCVCSICGKERDEGHNFQNVSACKQVCTYCKKSRIEHDYQKVDGKCIERCSRCGDEIPMQHNFVDGICTRCGIKQ